MNILPAVLLEQRVLLKTVTAKDAAMATTVLNRAGVAAHACGSLSHLLEEMDKGAGALLVTEEMLGDRGIAAFSAALRSQPAWSDLPVLILARTGADSLAIVDAMQMQASVTVIERPLRISSLISSVRSALRARSRQYELRATLDGLREADQRKTEFLATLAHELRNPLAPLNTSLQILTRATLDPHAARRYYEMMGRQVDHLVRLIDDLMEVSRITRGKIELQLESVALERIVRDAIEVSRPLLDSAGHVLEVHIPDCTWKVQGDRVRLTQVFANLLNNAAKYTAPGGQIAVRVHSCGEHRVQVAIADNGMGLAPDMLESIFGMFVQVSGTSRAAQGGLGIGLTLARSLVELHQGSITAHSAGIGQGSELRVELPLQEQRAITPRSAVGATAAPQLTDTILIVDDNRDAADSLAVLLQLLGATPLVAYSGSQALELIAGQPPTIAILDIGMPGMDGCELATRLRAELPHILLIAVTGWGQSADRERVSAAGFDHHILKPLEIAQLLQALQTAP